jgi:hopanoid biosynthesis associated protein HpnK
MPKFLIVTADDFGLHAAVNEAVEQAHRGGILTAASLMVSAPAALDAVRRARQLPTLRVGLHLVLADGLATLEPSLIRGLADGAGHMDGNMFSRGVRYFAVPSVRRQLEAEIDAQFAAFARTGLKLDHVNVHKHFHLHPSILTLLLRIGREYGVTAVRVPDEPFWFAAASAGVAAGLSCVLIQPWVSLVKRRLRRAGLLFNDHVFGIAASGAMNESTLLKVIARLPAGVTEIYLHPAATSGAITTSMSAYRHADELAALMSPRVRAALNQAGVECGGFSDFPRAASTRTRTRARTPQIR